jgi:hypothetical protein
MKYICLGYIEPGTFEGMTDNVTESTVGSSGVILANYERAGAVQIGMQ